MMRVAAAAAAAAAAVEDCLAAGSVFHRDRLFDFDTHLHGSGYRIRASSSQG